MNAQARYKEDPALAVENSMKGPLVRSFIFHAVIIALTTIGLPFVAKDPLVISTPISVEIVEIDKITQTNKVAKPTPAPEKQEAPKKEAPPEAKPEPPKMTEQAPPEPPKPAPVKKAEVEKPKPTPKKPEPPKQEPEKKKDFQTLLKNLTPAAPAVTETPAQAEPVEETTDTAPLALLSDRLTMSELDAFKHQIEPCWNIPAGAKFAEDLAVEVRVTMNRDMTVQSASILNQARYNRDSHFRAAADAALRALRNPRCSPLKLPPDKYDQWKTIVVRFDPSEML
jgi:hypothetical protein